MAINQTVSRIWEAVSSAYRNAPPTALLLVWFLSLIVLGTVALLLPWAHAPGKVGFLDALFTATSAACVTGLIVVDTATDFTALGQAIILILIQLGGLGIMTFAALGFRALGIRMPLTSQRALEDTLFQRSAASEAGHVFWLVLRIVVIIEAAGALFLFLGMGGQGTVAERAWSSVFHSVSAFCNAGFSIYSDSLEGFRNNPLVLATVMALIVLGGLGHAVLVELLDRAMGRIKRKDRKGTTKLSLNTRVVVTGTAILIPAGALFFLVFGLTRGSHDANLFSGPLFQSVTARTAGFNTVPIGDLTIPALLAILFLMFVGGAPGSCAGGIKITSFVMWFAIMWKELIGKRDATVWRMRIPDELMRRALLLGQFALAWNALGVILLSITESAPLHEVLFEQISAFATVGLSTGLTPELSVAGRVWIIVNMFVGRLGPLTLAIGLRRPRSTAVRYPEGRLMIG